MPSVTTILSIFHKFAFILYYLVDLQIVRYVRKYCESHWFVYNLCSFLPSFISSYVLENWDEVVCLMKWYDTRLYKIYCIHCSFSALNAFGVIFICHIWSFSHNSRWRLLHSDWMVHVSSVCMSFLWFQIFLQPQVLLALFIFSLMDLLPIQGENCNLILLFPLSCLLDFYDVHKSTCHYRFGLL